MNSWVSELAITATQEKLLLDECEDLLSTTADMQVRMKALYNIHSQIQTNISSKHDLTIPFSYFEIIQTIAPLIQWT